MEYINNIIEYYDELYPVTNEQKEFYKNLIKDYMPAKFLRIGCQTGAFEHWLSKEGHDVTGIELNQEMIETANRRRRLPNMALRFFQMSALEMTRFLGKGFYNVISCLNDNIVFTHDKTLLRKFFYDCKILLAEKGVLVLELSNYDGLNFESSLKLPVKESIRAKLYTEVREKEDGTYVLSQELEHMGKRTMPVLEDVEILPVSRADIEACGKEAGFTSIEFYEDFQLNPLTENSKTIVCLLR